MTIEERIAACRTLHGNTTDPGTCLAYWYELQGLLVAAGQAEPPTEFIADYVADYERGLEDGRALMQCTASSAGGTDHEPSDRQSEPGVSAGLGTASRGG